MARLCYIVAMIMLPLASASACNSPFIPITGSCFYFNETFMTWNDARDYCLSLSTDEYNSDLAVVHSCDQLGAIRQHIILEYGNVWHWVGGYDKGEEGSWHWVDGTTVQRGCPFWYPGRPPIDDTRNCLLVERLYGFFYDYPCDNIGPFICEQTVPSLASLDLN
ncbi:C-type lectin domain family 17, member A-like isoform X3 [Procambarus clarkii]|uniref:C-type lectin domain family 17, member A-like isoform X1 n=1 Tax=Procambarus clarkii TaxID=6728 RepID=UPI00374334DD